MGFIITSIIGATLIEKIRIYVANDLEYIGEYRQDLGRTMFWNESLQEKFKTIRESHSEDENLLQNSIAWINLIEIDTKNHSKIEGTAFLISISISLFGIILLKFSRFNIIKWIGFFLGIIFMRYFVTNSLDLFYSFKLCNEAKLIKYFGLPVYWTMIGFQIISILTGIWMVFQLPIRSKIKVLINAIISLSIGGTIWLTYAKYLISA